MKAFSPNLIDGGLSVDDRGTVTFVNDFNFKGVKRFYLVSNHAKGFVRAWHGHKKEGKYVLVVKGAAIIGVVGMKDSKAERFILSDKKPQILHIPAGNYNGFKTLTDDTQIMFFSTSTIEETGGDDYRKSADTWNIFESVER